MPRSPAYSAIFSIPKDLWTIREHIITPKSIHLPKPNTPTHLMCSWWRKYNQMHGKSGVKWTKSGYDRRLTCPFYKTHSAHQNKYNIQNHTILTLFMVLLMSPQSFCTQLPLYYMLLKGIYGKWIHNKHLNSTIHP